MKDRDTRYPRSPARFRGVSGRAERYAFACGGSFVAIARENCRDCC